MLAKVVIGFIILIVIGAGVFFTNDPVQSKRAGISGVQQSSKVPSKTVRAWVAPDTSSIPATPEGELIRYGQKLITNTSEYLGPKGSVASISNGMNCQNCHLNSGTKSFSNNFSMVASGYPRYRPRSARVESIEFRVNDCLERSLNGRKLDSLSKEMRAYVAFFNWIGKDVKKGEKIEDAGVGDLPLLDRAADPVRGKAAYLSKCKICHGAGGEGLLRHDSLGYTYPPLWGPNSYNTGAGLHRLTRLAGFIKNNMPFGATYETPQVTDEEAWDIAAYISSQTRPEKDFSKDWPDLASKPFDHPFGPYSDPYSEEQHKYGPFKPIQQAKEKARMAKSR